MTQPAQTKLIPVAEVLVLAALLEVVLQSLRAFFPLGYHLVGSLGFVVAPLVLALVFLTPLIAPLVRRVLGAKTIILLLIAAAFARLTLQAAPVLAVAMIAAALGVLALTVLLPHLAGGDFGPDVIASGTLVGLGIDIGLRAWRATDDVVWSSGVGAWLDPSLWLPLLILIAFLPVLRRDRRAPSTAPLWTWTVLLMPQLLLWTSLAFVASSGRIPLSVAALVLMLAVALAMGLLAMPHSQMPWWVPMSVIFACAIAMPWLSGWTVVVFAAIAIVATPLVIRQAALAARHRPWRPWVSAGTAAGGWLVMFALLVLYPLHYEIPLPLGNQWLPALAVLLAAIPFLRRAKPQPYEYAVPSSLHTPALVVTSVAALGVATTIHFGIIGGSPLPGPTPALATGSPNSDELVVATYNTGQSQDYRSGALAFRETTETIVALDADVIALQEVARGWPLTAMADFESWLRANSDYEIYYVPAADNQFGNALLSRVPLRNVTALDLGQQGGAQRRSALRAELLDGTTVYAMHLQARNTPAAQASRIDQMQQIVADARGRPRTILAGDLNPQNEYRDDSRTPPKVISDLEIFTAAGFETSQPTLLCTQPTSNDNCSDYVFHSPDVAQVRPNEVVDTTVSDHRPVIGRFQLPTSQ